MTADSLEPELDADDGTPWVGEPEAGQLGILEVKCDGQHWPLRYATDRCCGACKAAS